MTRERLIATAIELFGELGFEGANTRDIARHAGTTMSSITYYFGGKLGLYLATADHVAACVAKQLAPSLDQCDGTRPMDRARAIEMLLLLLDSFAQMMLSDVAAAWSQFIMREQQQPTQAFERLYEGAMRRIENAIVNAIQIARADLTDAEVRATGILLLGQAMILRAGRKSVTQMLRISEFDESAVKLLRERLRANILCVAEGPRALCREIR